MPRTTGLEVSRGCYVSFKPLLQCHPPPKDSVIPFPVFPEPFLLTLLDPHTWTITSMLFTYPCVSPEKLLVPLRQGQGQTYLHGPALSTGAGTKMSELLPAAKCPCHMPELPAGSSSPGSLSAVSWAPAPPAEEGSGPTGSSQWAF